MVRTLNLKLLLQSPVLNSSSSRTRTRVPGTTANASSGNPCREPSAGCVGAVAGPGVGALPPIVSRDTTGGLSSSGCWACAFALMPATPIAMPIKNSFPSAFIGPFLLPVAQRESTPAAVGHFLQPLNSFYSGNLQRGYFGRSKEGSATVAKAHPPRQPKPPVAYASACVRLRLFGNPTVHQNFP